MNVKPRSCLTLKMLEMTEPGMHFCQVDLHTVSENNLVESNAFQSIKLGEVGNP